MSESPDSDKHDALWRSCSDIPPNKLRIPRFFNENVLCIARCRTCQAQTSDEGKTSPMIGKKKAMQELQAIHDFHIG
jgi:hypothetical protein